MNDETLLFLIQPICFKRDTYTAILNNMYKAEEKLSSIGYVNPKNNPHEAVSNYIHCAFSNGPQSLHIDFLIKDISYHYDDAFFEELLGSDGVYIPEGIKIDHSKSFLNIYIVDDSVFTLSMQLCLKHQLTQCDDTIFKDFIIRFRQFLDSKSGFYEKIKSTALSNVIQTLKFLDIEALSEDVFIPPHTAHIFSSFMHEYNAQKAALINTIHAEEEGEPYAQYTLPDTKEDYFLRFGWSYTSMYAITYNELLKNLQISIHLSVRWFFWRHFNASTYDNLTSIMREKLNIKSIDYALSEHNTLDVIARILGAKDFQFISTLKPWQGKIYAEVQEYWKIADLRREALMTFETAKDVIKRKMDLYSQRIQKRHSSILFLIALMETFSIVSYINDYLSIIDIEKLPSKLHFIDPNFFNLFTIYMPLILLVLFFLVIIYITEFRMAIFRKYK